MTIPPNVLLSTTLPIIPTTRYRRRCHLLYRRIDFRFVPIVNHFLRSVVYCRFNLAAIRDVPLSASEDKCFKSLSAADGDPRLSTHQRCSRLNAIQQLRIGIPLVSDGTNSLIWKSQHYADRKPAFHHIREDRQGLRAAVRSRGKQGACSQSLEYSLYSAQFWRFSYGKGPVAVLIQPSEFLIIGGAALVQCCRQTRSRVEKDCEWRSPSFERIEVLKKRYIESLKMMFTLFVKRARKDWPGSR